MILYPESFERDSQVGQLELTLGVESCVGRSCTFQLDCGSEPVARGQDFIMVVMLNL